MASFDSGTKVVISAIVGNGIITLAKFFGWMITRSPSMLAEGIHSLADTSNQVLLYVGIRHSRGGPTAEYPFGMSNSRYVWNLISAMGIFFVGFGVTTYHGIHSLFYISEYTGEVSWLTIFILIFSFVVEFYVFLLAVKEVRHVKGNRTFFEHIRYGDDPTSVAVLLEDGIAVLGVLFALTGIGLSHFFESQYPDAIAATLIGLLLGVMALVLAVSNARLLIGVSADSDLEDEIRKFLETIPSVEKITKLKTEVLGPGKLWLGMEVEFHGTVLIDRSFFERQAKVIRDGEKDPLPVLVDTAESMVRVMGNEINRIERELHSKFPSLSVIDLEVN